MSAAAPSSTSKPFYASKTLWVNVLAVIFGTLEAQGVINTGLSADVQATVLGAVNIVLRLVTKNSVALS